MNILAPYLLFLGDATDPLSIKMAKSAADWSPDKCMGEFKTADCPLTTGLPFVTIEDAAKNGAKSFVLGFANSGGYLDRKWVPYIIQALEAGLNIVSGLHDKLCNIPEIQQKASALGRELIDIRHPSSTFKTGTGEIRAGKRLLTVGTDCSVGKMYTSLSITKALNNAGIKANFVATGQSGILVSGRGVAIDCVVSDFISGAVESISPAFTNHDWDIIEGQGSLSHPAFAGVSMGLLHGAQADALVVCHALSRNHMRGLPNHKLPSLRETIDMNEQHARLTNPNARVVGIAVNTSSVSEQEALEICQRYADEFSMPCFDPVRHNLDSLVGALA